MSTRADVSLRAPWKAVPKRPGFPDTLWNVEDANGEPFALSLSFADAHAIAALHPPVPDCCLVCDLPVNGEAYSFDGQFAHPKCVDDLSEEERHL